MHYKKKERQKKIIIIGSVIGILGLFIGLNLIFPHSIGKFSKDGISLIQKGINKPILYFKDRISKRQNLKEIEQKYNELLEKTSNHQLLSDENNELKKEITELKEQLNLNTLLADKKIINGTIINRNLEYWYDSMSVDKGSNDGVNKGMGVLYKGILVGEVTNVSYNNSTIRLLTNNEVNRKISVKIIVNGKEIYGLLVGYENGKYKIEGISDMDDIPNDSVVMTTGLGEIASGISIGKVSGVIKDNFGLAKIVEVSPLIEMDDITYVMLVGRK